jgi:hypothetical protein
VESSDPISAQEYGWVDTSRLAGLYMAVAAEDRVSAQV